ncbi:LOW QUALITY PROTEIN: hypothetical protein HID58_067815, partial [Brassica napus]
MEFPIRFLSRTTLFSVSSTPSASLLLLTHKGSGSTHMKISKLTVVSGVTSTLVNSQSLIDFPVFDEVEIATTRHFFGSFAIKRWSCYEDVSLGLGFKRFLQNSEKLPSLTKVNPKRLAETLILLATRPTYLLQMRGFQSSIDAEEESRQISKLQRKVMPMASLIIPNIEARVLLFDLPILMLQNSDAKLVLNSYIQTGETFHLEFMRDWLQHLASEEKKKKSKGDTFLSIFHTYIGHII